MIRALGASLLVAISLQGCNSTPPSADIYNNAPYAADEYARREAALRGDGTGPGILQPAGTRPNGAGAPAASPYAADQIDPQRRLGVQASPSNGIGISDEQSFDAVSARESIESDAERRARQASRYHVVTPGALPARTGEAGPNIVDYALQTTNVRGQPLYRRIFASEAKMQRNCARYPTSADAQRDFLARGGPDRDNQGIDPDGDGFACAWDPAPFRSVR